MSQQLVKKGANGGMVNVNPKSWIEAIKDKNTGQTLVEILQGFNMYFLPYNGNTSSTRCLVPTMLRKKGLWITYVKYDGNVYTEWYAADELDDKSWGDSSNWRIGNNTLVGDITISANGNWVINGTETEFKAVGEKGNTPLLRVANNRLQVSYDLGDTYRDVTNNPVYTKFRWLATTGDTQANNVGRIQASTDEGKTWTNMSNDFTNNLHIKKYIGVNESLPTSGIAEGTIYAKGPTYADGDTSHSNPIYRLWVYAWKGNTLAWQDNGEFQSIAAGVVQELGDNENAVPSQKLVTEKLTELGSEVGKAVYGYTQNIVIEFTQPYQWKKLPLPIVKGQQVLISGVGGTLNFYKEYTEEPGTNVSLDNGEISPDLFLWCRNLDKTGEYHIEVESNLKSNFYTKFCKWHPYNNALLELYIEGANEKLYIYSLLNSDTRRIIQIVNEDVSKVYQYLVASNYEGIENVTIDSDNIKIKAIIDWDKVYNYAVDYTDYRNREICNSAYDLRFSPSMFNEEKLLDVKKSIDSIDGKIEGIESQGIKIQPVSSVRTLDGHYIFGLSNSELFGDILEDNTFELEVFYLNDGQTYTLEGDLRFLTTFGLYDDAELTNCTFLYEKKKNESVYISDYQLKGSGNYLAVSKYKEDKNTDLECKLFLSESIKDAVQSIVNNINEELPIVNCIGDSMTMGAAEVIDGARKIHPYSIKLAELLEDKYNVKNNGIGGESSLTILGRTNVVVALTDEEFTIPYNRQWVEMSSKPLGGLVSSYDSVSSVKPLLQGGVEQGVYEYTSSYRAYYVYVKGIRCVLTNMNSTNTPYKLVRVIESDDTNDNVVVPKGTPVVFERMLYGRNSKCNILWIGNNDGTTASEVAEKIDSYVNGCNDRNIIVFGLHNTESNPNAFGDSDRLLYRKKYGNRFFDLDLWCKTTAMNDVGLTQTENDKEAINRGLCPPSLLADSIHFKSEVYDAIAIKVYNCMFELGLLTSPYK